MKLIETHGIKGYFLKEIKAKLTKEQYKEFSNWLRGQTVTRVDGKTVIYQWDYDRWRLGFKPYW